MELILLEKVQNLGDLGDRVNVKPGYGRNFLVPAGKAVPATPGNIKEFEARRAELEKAAMERLSTAEERLGALEGLEITIEANATEEGHLYGSVAAAEISRALKGKNLLVEPDMVKLADPIKECGVYSGIKLSIGYDIEATVEVVVIPQATSKK